MHLDGKFGISKDDTSYRDKEAGSEVFQFHHSSWSLGSFFLVVIQWLSHVWPFETPWTAVLQASLSLIISRSLLKRMSIESVMTSNHLIFCHPLLPSIFPSIRVFSNESVLHIRWPKYWSFSVSASVLPMNIQDWSPLGLTGLISLQSRGLSRVFSSTTVQKHHTWQSFYSDIWCHLTIDSYT